MHMRSVVIRMSVAGLALALSIGAAGCGGGGDQANSANASNTANRNAANANTAAANSSNTAVVTGTPAVIGGGSSSDDAAIKNKTEANLTKAGVSGVTVEVSGGVVTLKGDVPGAKFQDAVQAANEAGAKRVMNQLNRK